MLVSGAEPSGFLVIRLSAMGDFILALPAMAAIRRHHPTAHISAFDHMAAPLRRHGDGVGLVRQGRDRFAAALVRSGGLVAIETLAPRRPIQPRLRSAGSRSHRALFSPVLAGTAARMVGNRRRRVASAPRSQPPPHARARHPQGAVGLALESPIFRRARPRLARPRMCRNLELCPTASPFWSRVRRRNRPAKRWPAEYYGADLAIAPSPARGITPVVLGSAAEGKLAAAIRQICHETRDLTGRTSQFTIAALARRAVASVGNDTGPMHLIAMLRHSIPRSYSLAVSNPARSAPRGPNVTVLQRPDLRPFRSTRSSGGVAHLGLDERNIFGTCRSRVFVFSLRIVREK